MNFGLGPVTSAGGGDMVSHAWRPGGVPSASPRAASPHWPPDRGHEGEGQLLGEPGSGGSCDTSADMSHPT